MNLSAIGPEVIYFGGFVPGELLYSVDGFRVVWYSQLALRVHIRSLIMPCS